MMAISAARRLPYLAVGWLWYLGTLIPVIGVVQVLFRQGRLEEAIACFSRALRIKPGYVETRYNLELALQMADKPHKR